MKYYKIALLLLILNKIVIAQNPLAIPPSIIDTNFNLVIQNGVTQFYKGINTPTYGVNGSILGPTLIVNKFDWVTFNLKNTLTGFGNSTTIHWHGLHLPAKDDGGPHQIIEQGATWSPRFQILNNAGTFWYHPHGENKTNLHVSKGIAGMIIVKDSAEATINLPRTYGVDDFPIVVQTKTFDILNQIAIGSEEDTAICVNGTIDPFVNFPAQIIRLRLLNGASTRAFNFGFSNNKSFKMIASDGGLLDSAIILTRILLSPGERAEILIDLQGMQGTSNYLKSYSSELPNGIYGAKTVRSMMGGTIPEYEKNPLNGADFNILKINVVSQTPSPITTSPNKLINDTPWKNYTISRNFILAPDTMMSPIGQVFGPFNINGEHFDMEKINVTTNINTSEKWRVTNNTGIAHPFHKHDLPFYISNINGGKVPEYLKGKKDVVLVMPNQYVEFITKFEDFVDDKIPYMYHCHLLHHEDDGMMGSYRVIDPNSSIENLSIKSNLVIYPNPIEDKLYFKIDNISEIDNIMISNINGKTVLSLNQPNISNTIDISALVPGTYIIQFIDKSTKSTTTQKFVKK
jgi:blue copper oxidase